MVCSRMAASALLAEPRRQTVQGQVSKIHIFVRCFRDKHTAIRLNPDFATAGADYLQGRQSGPFDGFLQRVFPVLL